MFNKNCLKNILFIIAFLACLSFNAYADNPIVDYLYTADPAAFVANDKVYVICSHDLDNQGSYDMYDYFMMSSDDLLNWNYEGIVFDIREDTSWGWIAYAPDMTYKNGKYYLYFPNGSASIGVAISDSPTGPFREPLKGPLVSKDMPNCDVQWCFDPGIFVDDDGKAYLYFGGGGPGTSRVIQLNDDMISVKGTAVTIDAPNFFEASYMHKHDGTYYFSYSTNGNAGLTIDYMTSSNPMTGFKHRGTILPNPWDNLGNNNHHSIIEFNGNSYIFYHNRAVSGSVYQRSVCVDYLYYNSDGTIKEVVPTEKGINPGITPGPSPAPTPVPTGCDDAPEWNPDKQYMNEGTVVKYNNKLYKNKWYSLNNNPEENSGEFDVWILIQNCEGQNTPGPTIVPITPTPFSNLGDVNNDGLVDILDALLTAQFFVGLDPANFDKSNGDVNCDNSVDIVDSLLISQYYVGLIDSFCY